MFDLSELSEAAKNINEEIKQNVTEKIYGLWFADMIVLKLTESILAVSVDTEFQQMTIESRYTELIRQAVKKTCDYDVNVIVYNSDQGNTPITEDQINADERKIIDPDSTQIQNENYNIFKLPKSVPSVSPDSSGSSGSSSPSSVSSNDNIDSDILIVDEIPEFTLESGGQHGKINQAMLSFRSNYTFDNFIVGGSNRLTYVACTIVAKSPASKYNPLFIHGPSGLGKTHLLYAIANDCATRYKSSRIVYLKGEEFVNQFVESLADKDQSTFREKYRNCDMLLIDDIQFIAGKKSTQEELFHTFNALYESGKQVVFTSDRPPKDIQPLENRITSRFESGLITEIEPPDLELRIAILRRKANDMNVKVSNEVLLYLAENVTSNIRQIEGAIKKLDAYSGLSGTGSGITLELAKNSITDILSGTEPSNVTVDKVLSAVSRKFNISIEELKGKKRTREIVFARHVTIYIIRKITDMALIAIGKVFSRDHSTVLSSIDAIETELKDNPELASKIEEIINSVKI